MSYHWYDLPPGQELGVEETSGTGDSLVTFGDVNTYTFTSADDTTAGSWYSTEVV